MKKNIHVTRRKGGDWAVKGANDDRASSLHTTQTETIEAARPLTQKNQSELVIHVRDNRIRNSDSFGPDPNPPNDTEH
ncbi:MAG: DUF2188 domain-containing protein [Acidobacteriota bacterium]